MRPGPSGAQAAFSGHSQAGGAEQGCHRARPAPAPCHPVAGTRPTAPCRTELPRAVAGVPLAAAEPATLSRRHLLPGTAPAWALQRQRHCPGEQSSAPGTAVTPHPPPRYSQQLQAGEAQEGAVGEGRQGVLRQVAANTHRTHGPSPRGCSLPSPPARAGTGAWPDAGAGACTWPGGTSGGSQAPAHVPGGASPLLQRISCVKPRQKPYRRHHG